MNKIADHLLGHHINNAARHMHRRLQREFNKAGFAVTAEQWMVLIALFDKDGLTQNDLCEATTKDKPSITRILLNLEKNNLTTRVDNSADGRSKRVFLTAKAKKMEKGLFKIAGQIIPEATKGISSADIATCYKVLNKIIENIK